MKLQRLITIARPIDLPPLQLNASSGSDELAKKKPMLPLFGKRGQYKFSQTPAPSTAPATATKDIAKTETEYKSDEEEMEEDAEQLKAAKRLPASSSPKRTEKPIVESPTKLKKEKSGKKQLKMQVEEPAPVQPNRIDGEVPESTETDRLSSALAKKKRVRVRVRGERGRENVDFDDSGELVDTEKYSTWLPPENQSGDGSTTLNDKYGY